MEHLRVYQKILVLAPAHTFTSLTKKGSYIQRMYKDVSGVYMLVSPSGQLYIGSSVDLGRRMEEY